MYLTDSTTDEKEADRILRRLVGQVEERQKVRTRGTLRAAFADFMNTHEMAETTRETYELYRDKFIDPALGGTPVGKIDALVLERFYAELRRCRRRCDGQEFIEHRVHGPHECRVVRHKRGPGDPKGGRLSKTHDCAEAGCKVRECRTHECDPLPSGTILKIHYTLSGVFAAAIRWGWIVNNPCDVALKPRPAVPDPDPPTTEQAARIVEAAWEQDPMWGTLVWLVMVTGMRRAEVLALRWHHVDFATGNLTIRRNYLVVKGRPVEKDTKSHQRRRAALDPTTMEILAEHRARYEDRMKQLDLPPRDDAFLFSYADAFEKPCNPDAVTHRYIRTCKSAGIDSHLHALRHYAATELLTAGVDLRTVAGRLGHGGGGATTLRVYAAWQDEADRRAADILGRRMQRPKRSTGEPKDG